MYIITEKLLLIVFLEFTINPRQFIYGTLCKRTVIKNELFRTMTSPAQFQTLNALLQLDLFKSDFKKKNYMFKFNSSKQDCYLTAPFFILKQLKQKAKLCGTVP